jgi:chromate transporter
MSLFKLFLIFFKIGISGFGGGYGMISLIQKELVEKHKLISQEDFSESISLSHLSPGVMVINISAIIGYKIKGYKGMILSPLGLILPSFFIIILLSGFYLNYRNVPSVASILKGINIGVISLLSLLILNLFKIYGKGIKEIFIFLFTFLNISFLKIDPILAIAIAGGLGFLFFKGEKC